MSASPWLTLIVPGISAVLAQSAHAGSAAVQLAYIAGRGSLKCEWHRGDGRDAAWRPWQRGLLAALQLRSEHFASAPVSAFGSGAACAGEYWMHIEPVHFAAGLDRLTFLPLEGEARILATERTALAALIDEHLQPLDMQLHALSDGTWCARRAQALDIDTSNPEAAAAKELHLAMPCGADAGTLRRLMTELQMLLHDHPVNDLRARRGLPAINSVWMWGNGTLAKPGSAQELPPAFGDAPYLRGIYALHSACVSPAPATARSLVAAIEKLDRALAVIPASDIESFEAQWITPLTAALSSRRIARLDLILDGWHLQLDRSSLWRFWRKALPPSEWVA
jgi:hypothetical protein